jgi:hypothetical protein
MTDAVAGSVLGDDCKLYYSATLGGSGVLTEIPVIIDDTLASERRAVESNCRGDAEIGELIGKPKHTISGTLLVKRDTAGVGATFSALRDAYVNGTILHFAMATGDITHIGQYVFRLEGRLKRFEQSNPDNDTVKVSFEVTHAGENTYASNFSTVTA